MILDGQGGLAILAVVVLVGACAQVPRNDSPGPLPVVASPPRPAPETAARAPVVPAREPAPSLSQEALPAADKPVTPPGPAAAPPAPEVSPAQKSADAQRPAPAARASRKPGAKAAAAPQAVPRPPAAAVMPNAYREAARRALAVGDLRWAIHYYRQHLATHPRDADALVELGTIHYRSGDPGRGASLLYDAARSLIEAGDRARASRLLPLVAEGNPALARDLYGRLAPRPER